MFEWFRSKREPPPPPPDVLARLEKLERDWKNIEVEWDGWFDKFRRLYARLAKREQSQRDEGCPDCAKSAQDAPQSTNGVGVGVAPAVDPWVAVARSRKHYGGH